MDEIGSNTEFIETKAPGVSEIDTRLMQIVQGFGKRLRVVGVGGAGCNTMSRIFGIGIEGAQLVAMNTDAQSLLRTMAEKKVLLGERTCKGYGCGGKIEVGQKSAEESTALIADSLKGASITFLTCGLGGGTGSGAASVVSKVAKDVGSQVVVFATLPFNSEGLARWKNALIGLEKLQAVADTIVVVPNNKILELYSHLPLSQALDIGDSLLATTLKGIIEMVTRPGLVNRDIADLRAIFREGGIGVMGVGESEANNCDPLARLEYAIEDAMHSPLLDADVSTAHKALINIIGGPSLQLGDLKDTLKMVADKISPNAELMWGVQIDETLPGNKVRVMITTAGVKMLNGLPIGSLRCSDNTDFLGEMDMIEPIKPVNAVGSSARISRI